MTFSLASIQRSLEGHWWTARIQADVRQTQSFPGGLGKETWGKAYLKAPGSCRMLRNLVFPERVANFIGPCACWVILNPGVRLGSEVKRSFGSLPCLQTGFSQQRVIVCVQKVKTQVGAGGGSRAGSTCGE